MVPAPAHSTSVFMETCLASLWMLLFCSLWTPTEKQNTLLGEIQLLPALIIQFYLNSLNPFRKTLLKLENIYIYMYVCVYPKTVISPFNLEIISAHHKNMLLEKNKKKDKCRNSKRNGGRDWVWSWVFCTHSAKYSFWVWKFEMSKNVHTTKEPIKSQENVWQCTVIRTNNYLFSKLAFPKWGEQLVSLLRYKTKLHYGAIWQK